MAAFKQNKYVPVDKRRLRSMQDELVKRSYWANSDEQSRVQQSHLSLQGPHMSMKWTTDLNLDILIDELQLFSGNRERWPARFNPFSLFTLVCSFPSDLSKKTLLDLWGRENSENLEACIDVLNEIDLLQTNLAQNQEPVDLRQSRVRIASDVRMNIQQLVHSQVQQFYVKRVCQYLLECRQEDLLLEWQTVADIVQFGESK